MSFKDYQMKSNKLENLKSEDLIYFGYRIEPYFVTYLTVGGMQNEKKSQKILGLKSTVRWLQLNNYLYQFSSDLAKIKNEVKNKLKENGIKYVDYLIEKCLRAGEKLRKESIKFGKIADRLMDREDMSKAIHDCAEAFLDYTVFYQITNFEEATMQMAEKVIKNNTKAKQDAQELFGLISIADSLTAAEHEQDDFLRLAIAPRDKQESLAEKHAKKYGWLAVRYFVGDSWTKDDVLGRLRTVDRKQAKSELASKLSHRKEREKMIGRAIKNFSDGDKQIIKQIRKIIYLRTQRGDFFHESAAHVRPLLNKIAKELKITYFGLINLSAPEIMLALGDSFDYKKHIKNRMDNFLIYHGWQNNGEVEIIEGKEVEKYLITHQFLRMDTAGVSEFSGKIGYKGKTKGYVKILNNNNDIGKVEKGDIIVTAMTTANFLPALEKAAAFVTDEGGITCHAAIIAREMKKPCIIGTKIATKVLRDGDYVEVDANQGIVKKIKKYV